MIVTVPPAPDDPTTALPMNHFPARRVLALSLAAILLPGAGRAADGAYSFDDARRFLGQFCTDCHGPEKPKADLNLRRFETPDQVLADRKVWGEVLVRVREGEMPPKSAKREA